MAKDGRDIIILACTDCKHRNYTTTKNKRKHPERFAVKKFCSNCNKHTEHRETR